MNRRMAVAGLLIAAVAVLLTILWWPKHPPPEVQSRDSVARHATWSADGVYYFKAPERSLFLGIRPPEGPEWMSGMVTEEGSAARGFPQFVCSKPAQTVSLSLQTIDIPPEDQRRPREEQLSIIAGARAKQWQDSLGDSVVTVASNSSSTTIRIDGENAPATIVSVYLVKKDDDGAERQYRLSETLVLFRHGEDSLAAILRLERDVESDVPNLIKMQDAVKIEADGRLTFGAVKMGAELDAVRDSFSIATKPR